MATKPAYGPEKYENDLPDPLTDEENLRLYGEGFIERQLAQARARMKAAPQKVLDTAERRSRPRS